MDMKRLVVTGAGTSVIIKLVHAINRHQPTWDLVGFVDDDPGKKGALIHGYPVMGGLDLLATEDLADAYTVCFIYGGNIQTRLQVIDRLDAMDATYATLVHPSVDLDLVTSGTDCVIQSGSHIQSDVAIGDHCGVGLEAIIGHDVSVGDKVWIGPRATVLGRVKIEEGATLGAGCVIKGNVTVGSFAMVGMGAVVVHDVPAGTTVFGNPARVINRGALDTRHPY
jgi:sugar O-acyltransferase (sialic acid O-acetyltransferase NeuD family)